MNRPAKSGSISRSLSAKIISASPVLIRLQRRLTNGLKVSPRSKNRAVDDESGLKGLLRLPYDVLVVVYTFLDARDITRLSQVCTNSTDLRSCSRDIHCESIFRSAVPCIPSVVNRWYGQSVSRNYCRSLPYSSLTRSQTRLMSCPRLSLRILPTFNYSDAHS